VNKSKFLSNNGRYTCNADITATCIHDEVDIKIPNRDHRQIMLNKYRRMLFYNRLLLEGTFCLHGFDLI
jgi:hypothetical protein